MRFRLAVLFAAAAFGFAQRPVVEIKVDQVGYPAGAPKLALVAARERAAEFTVRRAENGAVELRGTLTEPAADPDSGDAVQTADFSALRRAGKYYLEVPGVGRGWTFSIGPDVYARTWYLATRSYYGQRCGTAVDLGAEFPGYKHEACHLTGALHASSGKEGEHVSRAGWHDAGDYGRYVVNSGITTGTLLWTWEMFAPRARLDLP